MRAIIAYSVRVHTLRLMLLAAALCIPAALCAQTTIIVNDAVNARSLSAKDILDIYTLNRVHWDDGTRISVFDLKGGKTKESFLAALGMTEEEFKRIWLRKQFTGKARPPRALATEEEVIDLVSRTPGAIGYVSERPAKNLPNVRIIAKVK